MKIIVAEWAPDQPELDSGTTQYVNNVIPITRQSYGPIGSLTAAGNALTNRCQGAASFRGTGGTIFNTSGDAGNLYSWDGTAWADVSKAATTYATAAEDMWSFGQFGNLVIAANGTDDIQVWTIGTSSAYDDLAGTPPVARGVAIVKDFVVLWRLASAQNKIHWSAINDATGWTIGTDQSDTNEFPVGGRIMGMGGGDYGVVFLESAIYLLVYLGIDPWFKSQPISLEVGCAAEGSIAQNEQDIFFLSQDGFRLLRNGQGIDPIGDQKIDRWFWRTVNQSYLYRIVSAVDPITGFYYCGLPSLNSVDGTPDMMLIYNPTIGRWSLVTLMLDYLFSARTNVGYHTDNIDTLLGDTDATGVSGDSNLFTGSARATLAAFDTAKKMAFFTGTNMEATIDTVEGEIFPGQRSFVSAIRPLCNGGTTSIRLGTRNNLYESVSFGALSAQNSVGLCVFRSNARFQRARCVINGIWTHFQGIDAAAVPMGGR